MDTEKAKGGDTVAELADESVKKRVELDTILIQEIGQIGLYQAKTIFLLAVAVIFLAWSNTEYLFTAARINTRCFIPECERTGEAQFAPPWILNAVPGTSATSFDSCQRFANISADNEVAEDTCPAVLFDRETTVDCDEYVYEHTDTVVYDFGLACDEWRRSFIGFMRTCGTLIGLPIAGFISDRWGRRMTLTIAAFNSAWLGLVRYWANTYSGFFISELIESVLGAGIFSSSYILVMELVGPKYRVAAGATMNTCFALGQITVGLIAWAIPYWRHLTLTLYIPQLLTLSYFWILSESVRWYMSKGLFKKAEIVLKNAAKTNGKQLSEESLMALKETVEEEKRKKALDEQQRTMEPMLIVQVFKYKAILLRCLITPVWWITTTFVYNGLTINSMHIAGNTYLNYIAVAAIEIPGYWTAVALMGKVGRKPVLAGAFWMCAICQLAYLFMPEDMYGVSLTVYLIAKCSIAMALTSGYVYTAELYPTRYRHSLFAFSSSIGRVGSIVAPLTPAFGDNLPFILFASFALLSGLLVLVTPETLGSKFPDTMEEAANLEASTILMSGRSAGLLRNSIDIVIEYVLTCDWLAHHSLGIDVFSLDNVIDDDIDEVTE